MRYLLDTSVLVYAVGDASHELSAPARAVIEQASLVSGYATTTPEVLQEFLHVRGRRRSRGDARELTQAFAAILTPLVTTTEAHLREGADLYASHADVGAFDCVLAAVARDDDDLVLVTADHRLAAIRDLPVELLDDIGR